MIRVLDDTRIKRRLTFLANIRTSYVTVGRTEYTAVGSHVPMRTGKCADRKRQVCKDTAS